MKVTAFLVSLLASLGATSGDENPLMCQDYLGGKCGDSSQPKEWNCCNSGYCQPLTSEYYQCVKKPDNCPIQETDVDYYGNDIETIKGIYPWECCDKCNEKDDCQGYTFVNENGDGQSACYLKSAMTMQARAEKKGAVSAHVNERGTCVSPGHVCVDNTASLCCEGSSVCTQWATGTYRCLEIPVACSDQEPGVDYYGNDLETIKGVLPSVCCDRCNADEHCAGYTFVADNDDGLSACYLKTAMIHESRVEKEGAVSAVVRSELSSDCDQAVGDSCGNSDDTSCCPENAYCMPWNSGYYQCVEESAECAVTETDIDYYGNDLRTVKGIFPWECCDECRGDSACGGYTFVNENEDGQSACYLKKYLDASTRTEKKGALSAMVNKDPVPCDNDVGDACGNAESGASCCAGESYCQPWNAGYYQCVESFDKKKCPMLLPGVDFYGDDLLTMYGLLPVGCCNVCHDYEGCRAFTFVNENEDGRSACYLKSGGGERRENPSAVSGVMAK